MTLLQDTVDFFYRIKPDYLTKGSKADHYYQFRVIGWPHYIHYEFLNRKREGKFSLDIHFENNNFDYSELKNRILSFKERIEIESLFKIHNQSDPRNLLCVYSDQTLNAEDYANMMLKLIELTKDTITEILPNLPQRLIDLENNNSDQEQTKMEIHLIHLNQILYGPPGTGKTYNTINKALEIIDTSFFKLNKMNRKLLVEKFNELRKEGRIEFVTFHQNYSYEDFIEGIKPDINNNENLTFYKKKGIFKAISERALKNLEDSKKTPEQINKELTFEEAIKSLKDKIDNSESDKRLLIDGTVAYFVPNPNEDDAFRYRADSWTSKGSDGSNRMKYDDLKEFYKNNIDERQQIKKLTNISGLAKQHATYYFKSYEKIKDIMNQITVEQTESVPIQNYVIIIDEINRANISRVFGELITLIEDDKRWGNDNQMELTLPSSSDENETFKVPKNLYIIGTMNTADKSIALLDIALRRRFKFIPMYPDYSLIEDNKLKGILEKLNQEIKKQKGTDFMIGHSFFIKKKFENLEILVNNDLLPLISEYFNNKEEKIKEIFKKAGITITSDDKTFQLRYNTYSESSQAQINE